MKKLFGPDFWRWFAVISAIGVSFGWLVADTPLVFVVSLVCLIVSGIGIWRFAPELKEEFKKMFDWI
jgi:hypothetical protein